jgi:hypothetical protein
LNWGIFDYGCKAGLGEFTAAGRGHNCGFVSTFVLNDDKEQFRGYPVGVRLLLRSLDNDPLLPHSMGADEDPSRAQRERDQPRRSGIRAIRCGRLKRIHKQTEGHKHHKSADN